MKHFLRIFFLLLWGCFLGHTVRPDHLPWNSNTLFVFPKEGRTPWLQAISAAEHHINIAAYKLSDPTIMEALYKAAARGVTINLLAQPDTFQHEQSANIETPLEEMKKHGIKVFTLSARFNQAHYKMITIDGRVGLISTGNLDTESFDGLLDQKCAPCRDFAVPVFDKKTVESMDRVFTADIHDQRVVPQNPHLIWGPDQSRSAFLKLINGAKKSIKIYQQDFQDEGMAEAVSGAARAGVKVQVIMMPFPFSKMKDNNIPNQTLMARAGVKVGLNQSNYIHAKIMVIDDKILCLTSCNFYGPSLDRTRELGILVTNPKQVEAMLDVFREDWEKSERVKPVF